MDGPSYVKILQSHLLPEARQQYAQQWRFQQYNDPNHRSKVSKEFLNCEISKTIDRPPSYPDRNPMENMWSILERRVEKWKTPNIEELETFT